MRTIIYGPSPSGKTFHSQAFRDFFGCDQIVDGWSPPGRRLSFSPPKRPGENALILTNVGADACRTAYPDARILSIGEARIALEQSDRQQPIPEIAFPIPMPDGEGYVVCHRPKDGEEQPWFLHAGVRVAFARPAWAGGSILLHILGGLKADDGYEEEGCAILLTPEGLRRLGEDLIAIADGRT